MLGSGQLNGASAEVTSALPLTDDEQDAIRENIVSATGGSTTISFRVDPSILGGLVVRVGDQVIDGSVAGQLQELRQNLA
jgi:ATP synthase F1 delta subunit